MKKYYFPGDLVMVVMNHFPILALKLMYKVSEMEGWRVDMNCSATPNDEILK